MFNCAQTPWLVPTNVELDTRDLEVRDLACTNGSFKTLSVNGEPVTNPNQTVSGTTTSFSGPLIVGGDLNVSGSSVLNGLFCTALMVNGESVVNPNQTVSGTTTSFSGPLVAGGDLTVSGSSALNGVSCTTLAVNGVQVEPFTQTISSSTNTTQKALSAGSQTGVIPAMSLEAGLWLVNVSIHFQVNANTASNSIAVYLYSGGTVQQTLSQLVPSVTSFLNTTISGSLLIQLNSTTNVEVNCRLASSATVYALASTTSAPSWMQAVRIA